MARGIPVSIGGVLQEALQAQGLGYLLHENKLRQNWIAVMGERAAAMATLESFRDYVLGIRVADSSWRNELHFQREAIRERANTVLGQKLVKDVRLG